MNQFHTKPIFKNTLQQILIQAKLVKWEVECQKTTSFPFLSINYFFKYGHF